MYGALKDIMTGRVSVYDGGWAEYSKNGLQKKWGIKKSEFTKTNLQIRDNPKFGLTKLFYAVFLYCYGM